MDLYQNYDSSTFPNRLMLGAVNTATRSKQKAIELEALHEKWLAPTAIRVNAIEQLKQIEAESAKRGLSTLSTGRPWPVESLRRRIEFETGPIPFLTPISEIPKDEYHEQVQNWKG